MRVDFTNRKTKWGFFIAGLLCLFTAFGLVTAFSGRFTPGSEGVSSENDPSEFVRPEENRAKRREKEAGEEKWIVYVTGAVLYPGVHEIQPESRVHDAISAAGGLSSQADPEAINLAARVEDGEHIKVPRKMETMEDTPSQSRSPATMSVPGERKDAGKNAKPRSGKVNINTATAEELRSLPGIGAKLSSLIIDYRENNAPSKKFKRIEELREIKGIGAKRFEAIRDFITVD